MLAGETFTFLGFLEQSQELREPPRAVLAGSDLSEQCLVDTFPVSLEWPQELRGPPRVVLAGSDLSEQRLVDQDL